MPVTNRQSYWLGTTPPTRSTAALLAPSRGPVRTVQPQVACQVDWGNPIARELAWLWTPTVDRDLAGNLAITKGSAYALSVRPSGLGLAPVANSMVTTSSARLRSSDTITLLAVVHCAAIASQTNPHPWVGNGIGSAGTTYLGQKAFDLGNTVRFEVYHSPDFNGFTAADAPGGIVAGRTAVYVATYRRADALRLYINGVLSATTAAGNFAANLKYQNQLAQVGRENGGSGSVLLSGIFQRALTDAEIQSISQNPWQLFLPTPNRIMVPA